MASNDAYGLLAESLGFQGSERLHKILKDLMTPDEAEIVAALPGSPADVAEKTGLAENMVVKALDELTMSGVVHPKGGFHNRDYFYFHRRIVGLLDSVTGTQQLDVVKDKALFESWEDFCIHEMYPAVGKTFAQIESPPTRIVPAVRAIKDLDGVEPHEDFRELLKAQDRISVIPCPCRQRRTAAGYDCDYTDETEHWHCLQFGAAADNIIARGAGRELTIEEALDVLEHVEEEGLLHTWPNNTTMTGVGVSCQCCRDCCIVNLPLEAVGEPISRMWAKSRYEAFIDHDKCEGCQDCVERCQFDAIEMVKPESQAGRKKSRKLKAEVDPEKCWGCGVCVQACDETEALGFKLVREAGHIPVLA